MRPWNEPASMNDYDLCKCWLYNVCSNIYKQNERVLLKLKCCWLNEHPIMLLSWNWSSVILISFHVVSVCRKTNASYVCNRSKGLQLIGCSCTKHCWSFVTETGISFWLCAQHASLSDQNCGINMEPLLSTRNHQLFTIQFYCKVLLPLSLQLQIIQ